MLKRILSFLLLLFLCTVYVFGQVSRQRTDNPLSAKGEQAPDFILKKVKSDETVQLSEYEGKQPVVLIFGSFT